MKSSRILDTGTVSIALLVLLASFIIYFGICLHHARMLLIARQKRGLVGWRPVIYFYGAELC